MLEFLRGFLYMDRLKVPPINNILLFWGPQSEYSCDPCFIPRRNHIHHIIADINVKGCNRLIALQVFKGFLYLDFLVINEFRIRCLKLEVTMAALAHYRLFWRVFLLENPVCLATAPALPCCCP